MFNKNNSVIVPAIIVALALSSSTAGRTEDEQERS